MGNDIWSQFPGSWRLVSYSATTREGGTAYPLGRAAQGRLTYEAGGRMSVQMANPERPAFAPIDPSAATDEEVRGAFDGYLAYYGTYTVDAERGTVTHHLEACLIPSWTDGDQVRHFELQGTRLTLRTPPMIFGGGERVSTLVWEKLP